MNPTPTPAEPATPDDGPADYITTITRNHAYTPEEARRDRLEHLRRRVFRVIEVGCSLIDKVELQVGNQISFDHHTRADPNAALAYERASRAFRRNVMLAIRLEHPEALALDPAPASPTSRPHPAAPRAIRPESLDAREPHEPHLRHENATEEYEHEYAEDELADLDGLPLDAQLDALRREMAASVQAAGYPVPPDIAAEPGHAAPQALIAAPAPPSRPHAAPTPEPHATQPARTAHHAPNARPHPPPW